MTVPTTLVPIPTLGTSFKQYPYPVERITASVITPSLTIALTSAPRPLPVLSIILMLVLFSSYPLPPLITSTENILRSLPTTTNNSAPVPDPMTLTSGGIHKG